MAVQLSAILGIAIGGAVALLLVGTAVAYLLLHRKHRASLKKIDHDFDQRRVHLSITDEDVMRMPGTRRVRPSPYNNSSGWAPVSSRESVAKKAFSPNPADIDTATGLPPWPVRIPRRLKKAQSSPAVRVPLATLSPITERSTNNTATSPTWSKATEPETDSKTQPSQGAFRGVYRLDSCPNLDISPNSLTPRPLFHNQQRSFSHGVLASIDNIGKARESDSSSFQDNAEFVKTQLAQMRRSSSLCSQQPGRAPTIPIPPLPFEVDAASRFRPMKIAAETSPRRGSGTSLLSGDTSVLDDMASKGFSQAETNSTSTSIGLGISNENQPKWNFSRIDRSASPLSAVQARNTRPHANQQYSFRASIHNSLPRSASSGLSMSLLDHNSPNPKVALDAARSNLDVPGKMEKTLSRRTKLPPASPLSKTNIFKISEDMKSKRASTSILQVVSGNPASPVKDPWTDRPTSIATEDPFRWDPKTSMQSEKPSAMKNGTGARRQGHKRQSCVRISNIPIIIPSRNSSSLLHEKEDLQQQPSITPLNTTSPSPFVFATNPQQAPSLQAFSPQLHLPKGIRSTRTTGTQPCHNEHLSPYSPTLSMIPHYATSTPTTSTSSPSTSPASTPTRPPSSSYRPAASRNPNRRRQIFPSSHSPAWPPLLSSSITPQDPPSDLSCPNAPNAAPTPRLSVYTTTSTTRPISTAEDNSSEGWDSRPPSFLFSFPSPPLPPSRHPLHVLPSTLSTTSRRRGSRSSPTKPQRSSPVRGPRPLPSSCSSTSPQRRRPYRNRVRKMSSSASPAGSGSVSRNRRSGSPAKMDTLRRSIMELRRMNSEVVREGEGKGLGYGHGRYLSLGGEEVEEKEEDGRGRDDGGVVKVMWGPREMGTVSPLRFGRNVGKKGGGPSSSPGKGSLYDGEGFLREGG
ncbi:MAG: hypothetical protein Q9184_004713 [Pyrenodesmia sp. 2 TL-2023]